MKGMDRIGRRLGMDRIGRRLALALAEGPRATVERALDRAADARRASNHLEVSPATFTERYRGRVPVLSVLGVALRRSSGGVELQFLARRAVEEFLRPTACLAPSPRGWRLEASAGGRRAAVVFAGRPGETPAGAFARALRRSCEALAPRGLHVENPAELALDVLAESAERVPLLLSIHDFSLFCPRPHHLPATADGDCHWTAAGGCALCQEEPQAAELAGARAALGPLLERAVGFVFPSRFLREAYAARLGGLSGLGATIDRIVEPAIALPASRPWRESAADLAHVAYVGNALPHKGAQLLLDLAPALRALGLRTSAYGGGDRAMLAALKRAGVETRGYYRAGSLTRRLVADSVDLVLLLSLWPESHSLALDECIAAGRPVLAFDRGALGERLRHGGGVLVDPARGGPGILEAIGDLRSGAIAVSPYEDPAPTPEHGAQAIEAVYRALGWISAD